ETSAAAPGRGSRRREGGRPARWRAAGRRSRSGSANTSLLWCCRPACMGHRQPANVSATYSMIAPDHLEPMPPRRRRRSPRRGARHPGSLGYLLGGVLVVAIGYLLIQRGVLPAPPGPTGPSPHVDGSADTRAAIARLGGSVRYGHVDPATGQRSGIRAPLPPPR